MARKTEAGATILLSALDEWLAVSAIGVEIGDADVLEATRLVRRIDLKFRLPDAIPICAAQRLRATLMQATRVACINPAEVSA